MAKCESRTKSSASSILITAKQLIKGAR